MIASIRSVRQGPLGEFLIFIWGRVAHLSSYQLSTINQLSREELLRRFRADN